MGTAYPGKSVIQPMRYRPLSNTGLEVAEICLGTMQFQWTCSEEDSYKVLDRYFEAGGNFLDTADVYSRWAPGLQGGEAETIIGKWMKDRGNRDKIVLATKVRGRMWDGPDGEGLGRSHILRACDDSLRRLQTDRIDLYQSHSEDPSASHDETMQAFADLNKQGKVRFVGCSNFSSAAMAEALKAGAKAGISYISVQPKYHLMYRRQFEQSLLPFVEKFNIAVIPYSPLAAGFLTGKYRRDGPPVRSARAAYIQPDLMTDKGFHAIDVLEKIAKRMGCTISQVALAWLLAHKWMTAPIIGANSTAQLDESLGASGIALDREDKAALDALAQPS